VRRLHRPQQALPEGSLRTPSHRPSHQLDGRMCTTIIPGLLLGLSSNSPQGRRSDQNGVHHSVWCIRLQTMSFGLKNAGATYQRAIQLCFTNQLHRNVEAYVDDVVVKTKEFDSFIPDLEETFNSLRSFRWKLNPTKCVFGVPSGKLLGFIVSHRGIEANPEKINAIMNMEAPTSIKDVQKLTECMAALNRFLSRLGRRGLPFFKLLKKQDKFKWSQEAADAL